MPAVRTTPKDVLIRVPKVEPYSNSYVPPSVRATEEAKKAAAAATAEGTTEAGTSAAAAADASTSAPSAAAAGAPLDAAAALATPSATAPTLSSADANASTSTNDQQTGATEAPKKKEKDRRERGNSPTLPFLSVEREEDQTVELSKAATSSAGWNSLLVWARRQRGAQWDASTALWQVDKYSREYYSFCQDPATTDRSKQPGDAKEGEAEKSAATTTAAAGAPAKEADEDEDKGPTRVSARNRGEEAAGGSPPPSAPLGRTVRLV